MRMAGQTPHAFCMPSDQAKLRKGDKVGTRRLDHSSPGALHSIVLGQIQLTDITGRTATWVSPLASKS